MKIFAIILIASFLLFGHCLQSLKFWMLLFKISNFTHTCILHNINVNIIAAFNKKYVIRETDATSDPWTIDLS